MNKVIRFAREFGRLYTDTHLTRSSAALSYFLTMTLFPLLIILYTMLGNSYVQAMRILEFAKNFIAAETADAIADFLQYVARNNSTAMMIAALAVLVTSASAAERTLHITIGEMQGGQRFQGLMGYLFSVIFALLFVAVLYFAIIVMLTGRQFINWLNGLLPFVDLGNSWNTLRFLVLAGLDYVMVWGIYKLFERRNDRYPTHTGAVLATLAMVGVSIAFSMIIGASARYPLVYGSLASVILLMFWLYTECLVIYCGAAFNIALRNLRQEERQRRFAPEMQDENE